MYTPACKPNRIVELLPGLPYDRSNGTPPAALDSASLIWFTEEMASRSLFEAVVMSSDVKRDCVASVEEFSCKSETCWCRPLTTIA
ncbi:hypothetical protein WH47_06598 [Habropoda laboriosa]|uniref:Uncharacterized protein n=1 Tax=Habropoda laboriosa TaxID=597456 RepID=A0A0L7QRI3_9HYME|nr:hypothetical protein WH47_06598 [Habropoda laboriosa]